jgi:hypothetical protein
LAVGQSFGSFSPRGARSKGDQQPDGRVAHNQKLQITLGVDIGILATRVLRARKTRKMLQDKRAGEIQGRRGQWAEPNRPSKGVTQGQYRGSPAGHRGMTSPAARARRQPQPLSFRARPNQEFTVHTSAYGKVCLSHSRRLHWASARHTSR